uniref:Carbamoyl phosphate synthase small chain n=1 Tax=Dasyclonium flaccidum TaxID=2007274 RepID=A0A1Z1MLC1_9FLOR|nr:carbamoyl phosphate synthase small subunit [Dasyclonium flaccidum]ARW66541.1 carbamoyl phosphate synthase small subunit [Dasyclonium flaccidum]
MSSIFYPAVLYLQDGSLYKGWSFSNINLSYGEIVFNTGMTGSQEIMTDPSYSGQVVVFTYPEIGNTGLNYEDNESNFIHIRGIVLKNISNTTSNWRSSISLKQYILNKRIPHIFGIDTRSLTQHLRLMGVMSGVIVNIDQKSGFNPSNLDIYFKKLDGLDLVQKVTTKYTYNVSFKDMFNPSRLFNTHLTFKTKKIIDNKVLILVIDFGLKFNILRRLLSLGCDVIVLPATCSYDQIICYNPDGLLLSNGPGNPLSVIYAINTVKKIIDFSMIPIFGICMGHQILNLALGAKTFKLRFGHRGLNHPTGLNKYSEITSQNHGFAVKSDSLCLNIDNSYNILKISNLNLNDATISGVLHRKLPIFSVQYHPEANPGPHDSDYLFKTFIQLIQLIKIKTSAI